MKIKHLLIGLFAFLLFVPTALAQSPAPTSQPQEISSFDLFWPVAPGKTADNSLYSLKILKENIRGMLIFGKAEKADYQIFLATKRIVETERLINEDKKDAALKTLEKAESQLQNALKNVEAAKASGGLGEPAGHISTQVNNIDTFLNWYKIKVGDDYKTKVENLLKSNLLIREKL